MSEMKRDERHFFHKGAEVPEWLIASRDVVGACAKFIVDCEVVLSSGRYWVLPSDIPDRKTGLEFSGIISVDGEGRFYAPTSDLVIPFQYEMYYAQPS